MAPPLQPIRITSEILLQLTSIDATRILYKVIMGVNKKKMAEVFVSYSFKDVEIAKFLCKHLEKEGLNVFRAPISVDPGERWDEKILKNLKNSTWILFLASKEACASPIVQQEIGVALGTEKNIIPVVWDMDPSELPGLVKNIQALDLRNMLLSDNSQIE